MRRNLFATATAFAVLFASGCTTDTGSDVATATNEATSSAPESATGETPSQTSTEIPAFDTTPPIKPVSHESADAVVNEMQQILADSAAGPQSPPSLDGIAKAIELGDRGREQFPEDENLLRACTALRYQSLGIEQDPAIVNARRLELGQFARLLVERNQGTPDQLGNMPGILLLEEAKALLTGGDTQKAWSSITDARQLGFDQSRLLLLIPDFAPLLKDEQIMGEIQTWLGEDIGLMIDQQQSFPLEFSLKSLTTEDQEITLSDYKGKVVIVDLWGTWCGPCRITIPDLVDLQDKYKEDLAVIGVNFEQTQAGLASYERSKSLLDDFLLKQPINYDCAYGDMELAKQVPEFGSFPTLVFLDRSGTVRLKMKGYQPGPILEAIVTNLMAN